MTKGRRRRIGIVNRTVFLMDRVAFTGLCMALLLGYGQWEWMWKWMWVTW